MAVQPGKRTASRASLPAEARNVCHADAGACGFDHELVRQRLAQRRLVDVSVDGLHGRAEGTQLLEEGKRRMVAGVEDQVGSPQSRDALLGQPAGAARQVRVGDHGQSQGALV